MTQLLDRSKLTSRWFKPFEDQEVEFLIRPIDRIQYMNVVSGSKPSSIMIDGDTALAAMEAGVLDWRGVRGPDGEPVKFSLRLLRDLDDIAVISAVVSEIMDISTLREDEAKN